MIVIGILSHKLQERDLWNESSFRSWISM